MNTILQKRIVEAARDYSDHNYIDEGVEVPAFIEGADFALKNQWISVEEALPALVDKKSGQSEVVFARVEHDNVFVAYYDYSNEHWYYNNHYGYDPQIYYKIIHWMPIPPLEGGEE